MAYFQPMASCLADGFFPSRLICKIKIFFDVFFTFFSYFFVGVGRAEHTQENTNACGHSGNTSACIEISFYRFALLARSRILKVATCFQTGKFLSRFLVWQNCGKNKQQKKRRISAGCKKDIRKDFERPEIYLQYTLFLTYKKYKQKKHKKAPLRSGAVLKKRLAREINEIEIFRNIQ